MSNESISIVLYFIITICLFIFTLWDESKPTGKLKTDGCLIIISVTCWPILVILLILGLLAERSEKGVEKLINKIFKYRAKHQGGEQ
jgi:hypothetical protein